MKKLLKDLLTIAIGFGIMYAFVSMASASGTLTSADYFGCWMGSGLVFGWRIANSIITATGLVSLLIKFVLSIFLGMFAAPVVLVKDIVSAVMEFRGARAAQ